MKYPPTFVGQGEILHICEGRADTFRCPPSLKLYITRARYGRFSSTYCLTPGSNQSGASYNCTAPGTLDKVKKKCDGKESCKLKAKNKYYGDLCPSSSNYLEVTYMCGSCAMSKF